MTRGAWPRSEMWSRQTERMGPCPAALSLPPLAITIWAANRRVTVWTKLKNSICTPRILLACDLRQCCVSWFSSVLDCWRKWVQGHVSHNMQGICKTKPYRTRYFNNACNFKLRDAQVLMGGIKIRQLCLYTRGKDIDISVPEDNSGE